MDKKDNHPITGYRDHGRIPERPDPERPDPEREEGKGDSKLNLSLAQVLGSAVAAVVAAFAAGQLGVYGTFLGAGVMSLVATSGGPIFQHFFSRTGKQIKDVTVPPKARQVPVRDPAPDWKDDEGHHTAQAVHNAEALQETGATRLLPAAPRESGTAIGTAGTAGAGRGTDDATHALSVDQVTRALRTGRPVESERPDEATRALRRQNGAGVGAGAGDEAAGATRALTRQGGSGDATRALPGDDATRVLGTVGRPSRAAGPDGPPGNGEFTDATTHGTKWRGWRRTLMPAVVVFVIAIGGITLYEAISGHSVSGGKGTSISDVFRPGHGSSGDGGPDAPPATPEPGQSENGGSPTPTPEDSQPSTDPGDRGDEHSEAPGSQDNDSSTPSPDPSEPRPGETDDSGSGDGDTETTPGDPGGSGSQDGGDGGADSGNGADGSGRLPQGTQPDPGGQG
ncbi:hypothetical protein MMF93_25385 [Streptomyces tubbatahanensis]|uniref:Uncharacterized protein n=1 Tax=Streptomyces tubbatahanensis TaxID=2923272 RepID=A0ABY3XYJ3_9ACTN|nr:hypothetical protein [Streptomyces tubbatahanensis]UNS99414.1 hypothetical protein MMF93_25385 [Streptomyces tubbatahanensis]